MSLLTKSSRDGVVRAVARRLIPILAAGALGAGSAFAVSQTIPREYKTTSQLFVSLGSAPTGGIDLGQAGVAARSYSQLGIAEVVLRPAMERVGDSDIKKFRGSTEVVQPRDAPIINVTFKDRDPQHAADAANAIAESFINQTRNLQSTLVGPARSQLEEQIATLQAQIKDGDARLAALRTDFARTPSRPDLQAQITQLDMSLQTLRQSLAQLLQTRDNMQLAAANSLNTLSLWQPAIPPPDPDSPRPLLNTAVGGIAAAMLAILLIAVVSYIDDRIRDFEGIRARLGISPLAEIIKTGSPDSPSGKLYLRDQPRAPVGEGFRSLRANVIFASVDREPRRILVTSAVMNEGKSVVSANLALAFAEAGTTAVLLDADLRRPSQHKLFELNTRGGLTALLAEKTLLRAHLDRYRISERLFVIPAGALPPNPGEMIASARMADLMRQLPELVDGILIVDTSPLLFAADSLSLAPKVDGCVLVIDAGRTGAREAGRAVEALRGVRATILGAVLNKVPLNEMAYEYRAATEGKGGGPKPRATAEPPGATR
ncbi:MAG: polysaccharide biosynthesis tyrosine autokinase [Chloroflexota bacterium]|nr:polysaccharide biosynthesis tyrosine autokinase [Chloroflexota bacterium]